MRLSYAVLLYLAVAAQVAAENDSDGSLAIGSIYLNAPLKQSRSAAFSQERRQNKKLFNFYARDGSNSKLPLVANLKMDVGKEILTDWPAKWWGCQEAVGGVGSGEYDDEPSIDRDVFISAQVENLVVKAHIAIKVELLSGGTLNNPPYYAKTGDISITEPPISTTAEFKILEIFRFNDLRGKGRPFLEAYATNGRIAITFQPTNSFLTSADSIDSDCFSLFEATSPLPKRRFYPSVQHSNTMKKRNVIGMTYLLFIAITPSDNVTQTTNVGAARPTTVSPPTQSQMLKYSLMSPPIAFHKRYRHSIYNVLCTDCSNAPLIKQLNIKYNETTGVLSAYCLSPAHPIPTFTWSLDNRPLKQDNRGLDGLEETLKVNRIRVSRKNSKIELSGLQQGRRHSLTCSSQNYFGHATLEQPFKIEDDKMAMLLLNDEHNRALQQQNKSAAFYDSDITTTSPMGLSCLGNLGKSVLDWAFLNPWISVFIGLAAVILILAVALLILKCVLRARYRRLKRNSGICSHGVRHHKDMSPSLNGGATTVIDSSVGGDDCAIHSNGRNYMTAESKLPLLGGSSSGGGSLKNGKLRNDHHRSAASLPRHHHHQHHPQHQHLAVLVGNGNVTSESVTETPGRRLSPGSEMSSEDTSTSNDKMMMMASSNSTASSSAGAVSATQAKGSPAVSHRQPGPPHVMAQSWHAHQLLPPASSENGVVYLAKDTNHYHFPNCPQINQYQQHHQQQQQQDYPVSIQPPPAPFYNTNPSPVAHCHPQRHLQPPTQIPAAENDVVVRLLPALSAASSLAEFLDHENDHIEVVPEEDEDGDSNADVGSCGGGRKVQIDDIDGDGDSLEQRPAVYHVNGNMQASSDSAQAIMSSSHTTAIYRPLVAASHNK